MALSSFVLGSQWWKLGNMKHVCKFFFRSVWKRVSIFCVIEKENYKKNLTWSALKYFCTITIMIIFLEMHVLSMFQLLIYFHMKTWGLIEGNGKKEKRCAGNSGPLSKLEFFCVSTFCSFYILALSSSMWFASHFCNISMWLCDCVF